MAIVKGKDVIGLNVVTVADGAIIENVDDIAYNPANHRVEALLVSSGGLFSSAKAIHMDDVRNIGENAVIVPDSSVMKSVKEIGDTVRSISSSNKHLVKTNVLTVDGKDLGKVTDIFFDSATGDVDSMEVSQGGLKTISEGKKSIRPEDIVTIGADATIVSTYTELKLDAQGEAGGVKGILNDAKDKASSAAETIRDTTQDAVENVKDGAQNTVETIRQKSSDLKDKSDDKVAELRVKAKDASDDARIEAEKLRLQAKDKATDLRVQAEVKGAQLREQAAEAGEVVRERAETVSRDTRAQAKDLSEEGKRRLGNVKETVEAKTRDTGAAANRPSHKVVEKSKKKVESKDGSVDIEEQTKVSVKK